MKRATLEEILEVSRIATNKLADLDKLLSPVEYDRALLMAMRSIASDIDLDIFGSLITVDSQEGIDTFVRHAPVALSAHLLIQCEFSEVRPWVEKLCAEDRIRSLIFRAAAQQDVEAGQMASHLDSVPVFLVRNSEEIASIICRLESNPYDALKLALNSERVALSFLEGNPS
jgi:hypothetical protein